MSSIDYFNLPWKDQWEWERMKLPTVTAKYVENSKTYAGKNPKRTSRSHGKEYFNY